MDKNSTILITGAGGLLGSALLKKLTEAGFNQLVPMLSSDCDLTDRAATFAFFDQQRPTYVFHLAGKVFGIGGNMAYKGESFYQNALINIHVAEASRRVKATKIVAMGTGAVYPYPSPSLPLKEQDVFLGRPHGAENAYAQAKRALLAQLEAYEESYGLKYGYVISANLYGPHDKFDSLYGHVVPSLIRKFSEALDSGGTVTVWGDGSAQRDFMYCSDAADALVLVMDHIEGPVNMGSGRVSYIRDIVDMLAKITGVTRVAWDSSKPNGQDFREYDLSKLYAAGFKPCMSFYQGLEETFKWYRTNKSTARL